MLIPPHLFNPAWELNIIGHLIESVWASILGFLLILFRMPEQKIYTREFKRLSLVSKLALFVAIIYFLLIPLIISDTARIYRDRKINFPA
jgi:Na+-driven multidrug efflux pump